MISLYNIGIRLYALLIKISSLFSTKARHFSQGRKRQKQRLMKKMSPEGPAIWFHASSVGEFEQSKPILSEIIKTSPGQRIMVSFFSPSAYNLYKNKELPYEVYYLPLDVKNDISSFIDSTNPSVLLIAKYEFWYHLLHQLRIRHIPVIFFSVIFLFLRII